MEHGGSPRRRFSFEDFDELVSTVLDREVQIVPTSEPEQGEAATPAELDKFIKENQ